MVGSKKITQKADTDLFANAIKALMKKKQFIFIFNLINFIK